MTSKNERNHYDLKEFENYCRKKPFQRDCLEKEKKHILDKPQSNFPLKMTTILQREQTCYCRLKTVKSIPFMISSKVQAILVTQNLSSANHFAKTIHQRTPTHKNKRIAARFFWYGIYNHVAD